MNEERRRNLQNGDQEKSLSVELAIELPPCEIKSNRCYLIRYRNPWKLFDMAQIFDDGRLNGCDYGIIECIEEHR